ncbi:triose-phosphate isomerase [Tumebacillus permanentifrigoris]|uniref:Triosephosphate isomerase n=1 Tax=Tumebacillus permanentifrigoris TaxID=378543 RepID=A0A316D8G7_9BACL|nr:triose-phosphate isomerase [Tumebacillus permanentifrigoris]PWK13086.1 triosephosphate isomerase [Tumebacillus permanentifrigoris]
MRKPILAGNWKMFKTVSQALSYVEHLEGLLAEIQGVEAADVVICAPATSLYPLHNQLEGSRIKLGAQNVHQAEEGAYTGESSAIMLKDAGANYVIIGHSERRQYFGETDESVNAKTQQALKHGLLPIVCVGEDLDQRNQGVTNTLVESQVRAAFSAVSVEDVTRCVVAYEPIWAIGTGMTATAQDANAVCAHIRTVLSDLYGKAAADQIRIQYGGSVKPDNIAELMSQSDIDGALVGGASLDPGSFSKLVKEAL